MIQINTLDLLPDYGKFAIDSLRRGYGQTIGNSLRRVLIGSIEGAAISAVRIDKVFHEFAPIPGVKEDTTELLLNIKDIAVQYTGTEPLDEASMTISVKGPGKVTGADINCPEGLTIVNPEVYIATISDPKVTLGIEFKVTSGHGYVLPEKQERHRNIIGLIPCGTHYTPVRKVNYIVEQTRVGQYSDYERLILEVWTNGSVRPNDAIAQAAAIVIESLRPFLGLGKVNLDTRFEMVAEESEELRDLPDIKIDDLDFSQRTLNSLRRAGMLSLRLLAITTENDLSAIRGFGKKSLFEVRDKLLEFGIEMKVTKGGKSIDMMDDDDEEDEY